VFGRGRLDVRQWLRGSGPRVVPYRHVFCYPPQEGQRDERQVVRNATISRPQITQFLQGRHLLRSLFHVAS
jgi:hypothetical protein